MNTNPMFKEDRHWPVQIQPMNLERDLLYFILK